MHIVAYYPLPFCMRILVSFFVILVAVLGPTLFAGAQEVEFHPRYDGIPVKKGARGAVTPTPVSDPSAGVIYSFARWRPAISDVCRLLELDRRRERVYLFVVSELKARPKSTSLRALLQEIKLDCTPKSGVRASPSPTSTPGGVAADSTVVSPVAESSLESARYPSTELLHQVSVLSAEMYERDAGRGGAFEAVKLFTDSLLAQKDLTPAERDYFGTLQAFFLAAWDGRPGGPLEPTPVPREKIKELFQ
jgi:hypothetical protein